MKHCSDNELYKLLQSDHVVREQAFAEIYARHSTRIYSYCRKIMSGSALADDVFQETFLVFLKTSQKEREMTNLPAYILRIARNLCLEHRNTPQTSVPLEGLEFTDGTAFQPESDELLKMISAALELVSAEQREAFILQMDYEMSYQEIADVMNVPVTTVRNWIVRAKSKLRQVLSSYLTVI